MVKHITKSVCVGGEDKFHSFNANSARKSLFVIFLSTNNVFMERSCMDSIHYVHACIAGKFIVLGFFELNSIVICY